jgi:hypothetical protein
MSCLNDSQIQAVADHEAAQDAVAHAESCRRCGERVVEFARRASRLERVVATPAVMPANLAARVRETIDGRAHIRHGESSRGYGGQARGATRLRYEPDARPFWLRAGWSTAAVVAAAIVAFVFIIPAIRGPETVSAAGILAESANRLSQVPQTGVELREYQLALDGIPRELTRDHPDGMYFIRQTIDHGRPGRFRFTSYIADGRLLSSLAQDPVTRNRVSLMRVDDRYYRFEFVIPPNDVPSLPEIERLHMEASIKMMQASGQHVLQESVHDGRKQYLVEVPQVSSANAGAVWDLTHARVLVDAEDFRVSEFSASGTFLRQPYTISYKMLTRSVVSSVDPAAFEVPHQAGEVLISGEGTANPAGDALIGALRELAKVKAAQ